MYLLTTCWLSLAGDELAHYHMYIRQGFVGKWYNLHYGDFAFFATCQISVMEILKIAIQII